MTDLNARVCTCGHTAHWHNAMMNGVVVAPLSAGEGECEANKDCDCRYFVFDHKDTIESLRRRVSELEATHAESGQLDLGTAA